MTFPHQVCKKGETLLLLDVNFPFTCQSCFWQWYFRLRLKFHLNLPEGWWKLRSIWTCFISTWAHQESFKSLANQKLMRHEENRICFFTEAYFLSNGSESSSLVTNLRKSACCILGNLIIEQTNIIPSPIHKNFDENRKKSSFSASS